MELYIDTSDNKQLIVRLNDGIKTLFEIKEIENPKADQVLRKIEQLCNEAGISVSQIQHVSVHRGPGSFTGVRVGVSIANALAFALGISVNNKSDSQIEEPTY